MEFVGFGVQGLVCEFGLSRVQDVGFRVWGLLGLGLMVFWGFQLGALGFGPSIHGEDAEMLDSGATTVQKRSSTERNLYGES